jgi:methionyl aminopeptidase
LSRVREITLKSEQDLAKIAAAGRVVARVLTEMSCAVQPGVTTLELDQMAESISAEMGARPSFKGYQGFPASICASVNEQVIHGIPNRIPLREGDVLGLDYGAYLDGFHADSAMTVPVGEIDEATQRLLRVTEEALWKAIGLVRPGVALGDIGGAVQRHCESNGFSVVREMVGHGIGRELHEPPEVPNYGRAGAGPRLRKGITFCIEPMINAGGREVETLPDGWTIVTKDGSRSAHYEHTVAVTSDGVMVLTDRRNGSLHGPGGA